MTDTHLDDEALSAALDGEATAAEESHLVSCPACRQRIDVLRGIALAVGGPVPPRPAAAVDAAVGAALGAALDAPLGAGEAVAGPAIIEEAEATTVVLPKAVAVVSQRGHLVIAVG